MTNDLASGALMLPFRGWGESFFIMGTKKAGRKTGFSAIIHLRVMVLSSMDRYTYRRIRDRYLPGEPVHSH